MSARGQAPKVDVNVLGQFSAKHWGGIARGIPGHVVQMIGTVVSYSATALLLAVILLVAILPARLVDAAAAWLGRRAYARGGRRSRQLRANLSVAMGPSVSAQEVNAAAGDVYASYGRYMVEYFTMIWPDWWRRHRRVEIDSSELAAAFEAGRGAIIVSMHAASFEIAARELRRRHAPISSAGERLRPHWLGRVFAMIRRQARIEVHDEREAARPLLRALRRNEAVGLAADRVIIGDGVPVQLCGETAILPKGPALLSIMSGAPLMPAFTRRLPDGRVQGYFGRGIDLRDLDRSSAGLQEGVQRMADVLTEMIGYGYRSWYALHPVWPTARVP